MGVRSASAARAVLLGLATGVRGTLGSTPLWVGAGTGGRVLMGLVMLGEASGDKVPGIPSRLAWPSLVSRVVSAGTGGALLARGLGAPVVPAVVLAAAVSPLGAAAGVRWRGFWGRDGRPAWVGGVIEDACALALAGAACRGVAR
ncbi:MULTISPECIES: hypothetical protein [unclassified Nocardiopsis]|uniref:hypothetical protein n=1 Tax=unclassified Nocardiopsis TaxID=2649073 RepID=UPI00135949BF|nr:MULTISPECIES: hypothetical protein [unclassified Nocardiopsis]